MNSHKENLHALTPCTAPFSTSLVYGPTHKEVELVLSLDANTASTSAVCTVHPAERNLHTLYDVCA